MKKSLWQHKSREANKIIFRTKKGFEFCSNMSKNLKCRNI